MSDEITGPGSLVALRQGHPELERCAAELGRALAAEDRATVQRAFEALRLLAFQHMETEENVAFPLAERLDPDQAGLIRSLRVAHIMIRKDLETVGEQIERGHLEAAHTVLDAFVESMEAHERLEDHLIAALDKG